MEDAYYNPKTGFLSANKMKLKTGKSYKKYLEKQLTYQLHYSGEKPKYYKIVSKGINNNFQVDLMDMSNVSSISKNKNYNWLLNVIDVYSRYAWSFPIKRKSPNQVLDAFKKINVIPKNINMDDGNEFKGVFKKYLLENNVKLFISEKDDVYKNSIVERFNLTLRNLLKKYWTYSKSYNFINVIDDFIFNYNHTPHKTFKNKLSPNDVYNKKKLNIYQYEKRDVDDFVIGNKARIKILKNKFDKGDKIKWSEKLYKIVNRIKNRYTLEDDEGNRITKKYNEIMIVKKPDKKRKIVENDKREEQKKIKRIKRKINKEGIFDTGKEVIIRIPKNREKRLIGKKLIKNKISGKVKSYKDPYYNIIFENGNEEKMTKRVLQKYLI